MLSGRFVSVLQIFTADSCQRGPLLRTGLFVINPVRSGILGLLPCDRCGVFGRGHFRNHRSCGRSLGSRRSSRLKDCRGNQRDGQQYRKQAIPQPSFIQFLYHIFYHIFCHKYFLPPCVFFLLIYILQQIYMVCKKENNAPPRGGAFVRYKLVKMGFLSNWLLEFVFLTYELPLFVSFHSHHRKQLSTYRICCHHFLVLRYYQLILM